MNILIIYGSLREKSLNKALAHAAQTMAPEGVDIELTGVGDLPLYNQDLEGEKEYPAVARAFKEKIRTADGVIIVTPEYNRGISGALKNAIDWTSRPSGQHPWGGKPIGVMGVSSGDRGTIVAQYDLKRTLNYFGSHVMGQPEFYLNGTGKFDDAMKLTDEKTKEYVVRYLTAFKAHVEKLS